MPYPKLFLDSNLKPVFCPLPLCPSASHSQFNTGYVEALWNSRWEVSLLMKSFPDLGISFPITVEQIGREMIPKAGCNWQPKEEDCCPSSSSTRIKSLATVVTDWQCTLKGIQDKSKIKCSVLQKNRPVRYLGTFQDKKLTNSDFCIFLRCLMLLLRYTLECMYSIAKLIYTGHSPCLFGVVPQS